MNNGMVTAHLRGVGIERQEEDSLYLWRQCKSVDALSAVLRTAPSRRSLR